MTNFEKHINVEVNSRQNPSKTLVTYNTEVLKLNIFGGRNRLTLDMLSAKNTKYVIKWNYVLNEDIVIPTGCILQFDGGNITNDNDKNYTITGQDTILESCQYESEILKNIVLKGGWRKYTGNSILDLTSGYTGSIASLQTLVNSINSNKADKSDNLSSYGIKDAYTKTAVDALISEEKDRAITAENTKANKSTTLSGYNILDAYTKTEVNNLIVNAPETPVVILDIAQGSTAEATLEAVETDDRPNKIFYVRNNSNTAFSEYAWNGTNWILLANHSTGIDDVPTPNSNNLAKSGGILSTIKEESAAVFECINTPDGIIQCDNTYSVSESSFSPVSDLVYKKIQDISGFSVVNSTNDVLTLDSSYGVENLKDFWFNRTGIEDPRVFKFSNIISDLKELDSSADCHVLNNELRLFFPNDKTREPFVGFPVMLVHKGVLYAIYRISLDHDYTPNYEETKFYYKYTKDGINWSERYYIEFPRSQEDDIKIDWRAYHWVDAGEYITGCSWYRSSPITSSSRPSQWASFLVKIVLNEDLTLSLVKILSFPYLKGWTTDDTIYFDRWAFNGKNRNDGYSGICVGGMPIIRKGVMYIPCYAESGAADMASVCIISWVVNESLTINANNFKLCGMMHSTHFPVFPNESTIWFDNAGVLKTLVRFDGRAGYSNGVYRRAGYNHSKIYIINFSTKKYEFVCECEMCQGPSSVHLESDNTIIFGRGLMLNSNAILYNDKANIVLSDYNRYDTPGTRGGVYVALNEGNNWTDSFYGGTAYFKGKYYYSFYKRLPESRKTTVISLLTFDRFKVKNLNNYNLISEKTNMGTILKNNNISFNSNYKYFIPTASIVDYTKVVAYYKPSFRNADPLDLNGIIVANLGVVLGKCGEVDGRDQMLLLTLKDTEHNICVYIKVNKTYKDSTSDYLRSEFIYLNGGYIKLIIRGGEENNNNFVLDTNTGVHTTLLNFSIVINTKNNKCFNHISLLWSYSTEATYGAWYSGAPKDTNSNPEIAAQLYNTLNEVPNGIRIDSTYHGRIQLTGATVNGIPILSISPFENEIGVCENVSKKNLYTWDGNWLNGDNIWRSLNNLFIPNYNDEILKLILQVK